MTMSLMLRFVLGVANVPDETVAKLDTGLPGMQRIVAAAKEAAPEIDAALPHLQALEPHLQKLVPIAIKAWPDIKAVAPVISDFIDIATGKGKT